MGIGGHSGLLERSDSADDLPVPTPRTEVPEALARNLRALAERDLELVQRLVLPAGSEHLRFDEQGRALYRHHREFTLLEGVDIDLPDAAEVLWFGLGVGDGLAAGLRARQDLRVCAWERDPWMLRQLLARHDLAEDLASGRLKLHLGVDALDLAGSELPMVEHSVLAQVYGSERHLITHGADQPRVCLAVGKLFVDDLGAALRRHGYAVVPLDDQRWSTEELAFAIAKADPRFLARINYTGGLAEFAHGQDVPLVVWEIDPSTDTIGPPTTPTTGAHIFSFREVNVASFRSAGFAHVEHLPLAAPVDRRRPMALEADEVQRYTAPISFVGASLVDSAEQLGARLEARYGEFAQFAGEEGRELFRSACRALLDEQAAADRWILPELFEQRFGDFTRACSAQVGSEDPVNLLAERAASERRLATVEALAPQGIHVWGDRGFERVAGVNYRGPATHGDELTRIYNGAQVNVDVGRAYQGDIVTMRVFDVLACGGFLLAERTPALEELFDVGREVEAYSTLEELRSKAAHYLAHPSEARAMAEAGRAAVLSRHAFDQRVAHILQRSGLALDRSQRGLPAA